MMVNKKRHIAKTITYRLLSSSLSLLIVFYFTGSWAIGASFSLMELVVKPIQYYLHERLWYKYIKFGLNKHKDEK